MAEKRAAAADSSVAEAADELYREPPEQFVAARAERSKALRSAGNAAAAKQVAALRKPTVGAWLVNLLVADEPELAGQVSALAEQLRTAQAQLAGDELRALGRQRQELVSGLVARARRLARDAGRPATGAVLDGEVESTLRAALADPDVARNVLSGRLVHGTEFAGFGLTTSSATAKDRLDTRPTTKAATRMSGSDATPNPAEQRRAEQQQRERERLRKAQGVLQEARSEQTAAEAEAATATEQLASARERIEELRARLEQAEQELETAAAADRDAGRRARNAAKAVKTAQASVDRARKRADP